jgi:plasmid maintenance system antidote protein VapI
MAGSVQVSFFKKIKSMLNPQLSLAGEIADLLGVSTDSAYRRIRGETALSMEEIILLQKHFKVSLEELDSMEDKVCFTYKMIGSSEITFENYLRPILEDLKKINRAETREIFYAAKDIPLFHHFRYPELAAFKIYFWMKSILNSTSHEHLLFDASEIRTEDVSLGQEILKLYTVIPAAEIWTEETLNSTLKQVEYSWESGFFSKKEDALLICDQLSEMIQHIKKQAELGYKYLQNQEAIQDEGNFRLYFSDVMIGNNNILVKAGESMGTYLTHNTLNYLITMNQEFCRETESWLKNLMRKSVILSGASEKQRNQFFRRAQDSIKELRSSIEQGS